MIKILFVCLGNICRSPMAEFVFKDLIEKEGLKDKFYVKSAGTSNEEEGNSVHYGTVNKLKEVGVKVDLEKVVIQLKKGDYDFYDYIICMEQKNISDVLRIIGKDSHNKVYKLLDFSDASKKKDIADPWYTGNFDKTYTDILEGCKGLLENLRKKM